MAFCPKNNGVEECADDEDCREGSVPVIAEGVRGEIEIRNEK